jgi:hypothetical protein
VELGDPELGEPELGAAGVVGVLGAGDGEGLTAGAAATGVGWLTVGRGGGGGAMLTTTGAAASA